MIKCVAKIRITKKEYPTPALGVDFLTYCFGHVHLREPQNASLVKGTIGSGKIYPFTSIFFLFILIVVRYIWRIYVHLPISYCLLCPRLEGFTFVHPSDRFCYCIALTEYEIEIKVEKWRCLCLIDTFLVSIQLVICYLIHSLQTLCSVLGLPYLFLFFLLWKVQILYLLF